MAHFGDIIQEYYVDQFRDGLEIRRQEIASLQSPADVASYITKIQRKLSVAYKLKIPKTSLKPRIVSTLKHDSFTVQNIIVDSRPGYPVSLNLYIPADIKKRTPAILQCCGHMPEGKAYSKYVKAAISLCLKGCIVLVPDPIGQGERSHYRGCDNSIANVHEHCLHNKRLLAVGDSFANWRIHDIRRCIDYLWFHDNVDRKRIGIMGNSGGGTMATIVNALDKRIAAAAPNCYVTRWLSNVENELAADGEQIPFAFAKNGGDLADFLIAAAPRPLLISGELNDFFDIRGTFDVVEELARIYKILKRPNDIQFTFGNQSHDFNLGAREDTYEFFAEYFKLDSTRREPDIPELSEEHLSCGLAQLYALPYPPNTIHDHIEQKLQAADETRQKNSPEQIKAKLKRTLKISKAPTQVPHYRQLRPQRVGDRIFSRYGVEWEQGIVTTLVMPDKQPFFHLPSADVAVLYIPNQDAKNELKNRPFNDEYRLFGLDYRGVGESMPNGCDQPPERDFFHPYQFDYHYDALAKLLGESYLGGRVSDIIATIQLLKTQVSPDIVITASGIGQIPAILAAFLSPYPVQLRIDEPLITFRDAVKNIYCPIPQSMIPTNILNIADLDQIYSLVENR